MADALIVRRGGGGGKIDGTVQQYKVADGESVKAGDFVEMLPQLNEPVYMQWSEGGNFSGVEIVGLEEGKALYCYHTGSNGYCFAKVARKTADGLECGAAVQITTRTDNASTAPRPMALCRLDSERVFAGYYTKNDDGVYAPFGQVLTVDGLEVAAGAEVSLGSQTYTSSSAYGVNGVLLEKNKVLITYSYQYNDIAVSLVEIDGTAVSVSMEGTKVTNGRMGINKASICAMTDSRVMVVGSGGGSTSYYYPYALLIDVGADGFTFVETQLGTTQTQGRYNSAARLSADKVFTTNSYDSNLYVGYCVLNITDGAVNAPTATGLVINTSNYAQYHDMLILPGDFYAVMAHAGSSMSDTGGPRYALGQVANATAVAYVSATYLLRDSGEATYLKVCRAGSGLFAVSRTGLWYTSLHVKKAGGGIPVVGVAKAGGTGGDVIEIYTI